MRITWILCALVLVSCGNSSEKCLSAPTIDISRDDALGDDVRSIRDPRAIDGDTIAFVDSEPHLMRVRIIGIDTPEEGKCGYDEATMALEKMLASGQVTIVEGGTDDQDKNGRFLRYVEVDGQDVGLELIKSGLAIARYDSRDGYAKHLREDLYIKTDLSSTKKCPPSAWKK